MTKQEIIGIAKKAPRITKDNFLFKICLDKHVLDVGCIGQDRIYTSQNWLHNKLQKVAKKIDGVDILVDEIKELKSQGYSIYSVAELEETNETYEVVLMSDVVEHVNDPVSFLQFYARFLNLDGVMFVSTPNSNRSNNFINILFNNNYSVNPEHTFWFCPRTFAEVVNRAGLVIDEFYWADHYATAPVRGLYQKFKFMLVNILRNVRSNFNSNMIFVIRKK